MTDARDSPREDHPDTVGGGGEDALSTEAVYEAMEPLDPYTTGELASLLGVPGDASGGS